MRFRFSLHNEILGSDTLEKNPQGWETMEVLIKRGLETHGIFYEQGVNLKFFCNGGGKEFIDKVRDEQGIDGIINILIEIACDCEDGGEAPDYSIDYSDDYGSKEQGDCVYEDFYNGIIEMKSWNTDDVYTSVNIIQSDFLQKVRNRLDTKVDLFSLESLDGVPLSPFTKGPYTINLHSKVIKQTGEYNYPSPPDTSGDHTPEGWIQEGNDLDNPYTVGSGTSIRQHSFCQTLIPEVAIFNETAGYNDEALNTLVRSDTYPYADDNQIQSDVFFDILNPIENTYHIKGKIKFGMDCLIYTLVSRQMVQRIKNLRFYVKAGGSIIFFQDFADFEGVITSVGLAPAPEIVLPFTEFSVEFDLPNQLLSFDDTIQIYFKYNSEREMQGAGALASYSVAYNIFSYVKYEFDISNKSHVVMIADSFTDGTEAKAFAIFESGARIAQVISDREDVFRSNYFGRLESQPFAYFQDGCGSKRALLNGFMVRGFPTEGEQQRTIRISMNDYYKGLNAIDNLGLGIEMIDGLYYVVIEPKKYFYNSSMVLLTFSNIRDLVIAEAPEYYYGRVNIGYDKWETEFSNGLDEFNSKRQFDTGIKAVENELVVESTLVASGYRLEFARRKRYTETVTEDTEFDEDNFIVCLNKDNMTICEKNENFAIVNNVISPETSYNLRLWPEFNYLRWNSVINAGLTKYAGRKVKFTSGEGNYKAEMQFIDEDCSGNWNNELLIGGQPIQWDDLNNTDKNPLWLPEVATLKYPISYTDFKVLLNNPKGVIMISATDKDHIPYYILEVRYIPANGGLADFKLLRAFV